MHKIFLTFKLATAISASDLNLKSTICVDTHEKSVLYTTIKILYILDHPL